MGPSLPPLCNDQIWQECIRIFILSELFYGGYRIPKIPAVAYLRKILYFSVVIVMSSFFLRTRCSYWQLRGIRWLWATNWKNSVETGTPDSLWSVGTLYDGDRKVEYVLLVLVVRKSDHPYWFFGMAPFRCSEAKGFYTPVKAFVQALTEFILLQLESNFTWSNWF